MYLFLNLTINPTKSITQLYHVVCRTLFSYNAKNIEILSKSFVPVLLWVKPYIFNNQTIA